jgi:probable phosphoglycerate mutase
MSDAERPDVWLVRHGATDWSESGRHTGRTDVPLTDEGRAQARALGRRLAAMEFRTVLSSPLRRALETCRLAGFGDGATIDPDLQEWDYGAYEGRSTAEIRETIPDWSIWSHPVAGGESVAELGGRVDRVVARLRADPGPIAVFAHGHVLRVLAARWIGLEPWAGASFILDTATISILGWERETPAIVRWNDD